MLLPKSKKDNEVIIYVTQGKTMWFTGLVHSNCSVELKFVCWYDLMDVVTPYTTTSIMQTEEMTACSQCSSAS